MYVGPTGNRKSSWAALTQAHFGSGFTWNNLPGSWSGSANVNELLLHQAKDALVVIDDLKRQGDRRTTDKVFSDANRVLTQVGNRSSRARLWSDGTMRPDRPPRGLLVLTGGEEPPGEPCKARRLALWVGRDDFPLAKLIPLAQQAEDGLFAAAMSAYLRRQATQRERLREQLKERRPALRAQLVKEAGAHARTPNILADLAAGWEVYLDFAWHYAEAIDRAKRNEIWAEVWAGLLEAAREQAAGLVALGPVQRFREPLPAALAAGSCHVAQTNGSPPANAAAWGWTADGKGSGPQIGWLAFVEGGRVYPGWAQLGAVSGRASCKQPNPMGCPKTATYRTCFRAPPGRVLIKADNFGPHQRGKFGPNHQQLLHYYVADPGRFTFNADAVRVPSDRQTKYKDKRANPKGRVPGDVWHFPRVCGTFKRRADHVCQTPDELLGRVVLACSNPGDLVVDPFAGSASAGAPPRLRRLTVTEAARLQSFPAGLW